MVLRNANTHSINFARPSALMPFAQLNTLTMTQVRGFAYDKKVIDHYENPRNVGSFAKGDSMVGTGLVGAPACGDVMKL